MSSSEFFLGGGTIVVPDSSDTKWLDNLFDEPLEKESSNLGSAIGIIAGFAVISAVTLSVAVYLRVSDGAQVPNAEFFLWSGKAVLAILGLG